MTGFYAMAHCPSCGGDLDLVRAEEQTSVHFARSVVTCPVCHSEFFLTVTLHPVPPSRRSDAA